MTTSSPTTLVTAKQYADMDGVGCVIPYAHYLSQKNSGSKYEAAFGEGVHIESEYVCEQLGVMPKIIHDASEYDEFILLDASEPKGLPKGFRPEDTVEVIDHRMFADYAAFPRAKFRVEPIGAAATLIAEYFYFDRSVPLSKQHAALLLCGIYSNTVNFQADVTTFRDHRMKDWLAEVAGPELADLPSKMLDHKSRYALDHLAEVLRSDAKDGYTDFALDSPLVIFQLETTLAEETLADPARLLEEMRRLYPDRQHQLLIIQDIRAGKTWLLSPRPEIQQLLRATALPITPTDRDNLALIPKVTMRKSVLKSLLDARS